MTDRTQAGGPAAGDRTLIVLTHRPDLFAGAAWERGPALVPAPPAPARFSTTTFCPSSLASCTSDTRDDDRREIARSRRRSSLSHCSDTRMEMQQQRPDPTD